MMRTVCYQQVFTGDKMNQLSSNQANAVTDSQKAQLDPTQLANLNQKTTLVEEDTTVFGGGGGNSGKCMCAVK